MTGLIGVGDDSRVSRQIDPPDPEEGSLTGAVDEGYFSFCNLPGQRLGLSFIQYVLGWEEGELD